jgi:hypothetical protein
MSHGPQNVDSIASGVELGVGPDAVDPELLALPVPPRGRRLFAMTLMAAVMVGSVALIGQIRGDIAYFFSPDTVIDLGPARLAAPADMPTNAFVRVVGTPMLSKMVKFTQPLTGSEQVVFPLAGQRHLFVQVPLDDLNDPDKGARGEFFGRLVTFADLRGRMGAVQGYLHDAMDMPVTSESFVLIVDEGPESFLWAPLLAALCLAFIALTVWMLLRWFRPLPLTARPLTRRA